MATVAASRISCLVHPAFKALYACPTMQYSHLEYTEIAIQINSLSFEEMLPSESAAPIKPDKEPNASGLESPKALHTVIGIF